MGVLFGRERRAWQPEPPIPPFPGADVWGRTNLAMRPAKSLSVPTVWQCVALMANSVSMLPLETYRRTTGVPLRITDPPVVAAPAAGMTQSEWLHSLMVSLMIYGNAYARIASRDSMQRPSQLELLDPSIVDPKVEDGKITYQIRSGPQASQTFTPNEIWHVKGFTMPGDKVGLSPIDHAAIVLSLDITSRQFAADYFAGGGVPKAILTTSGPVTQEQARTVKERFLAATRSREPIVLGQNVDYKQVQITPNESQFLETQKFQIGRIAAFLGVPPEMVGGDSGGSLTYANVEQRSLDFLTYSVSFWLKRIEDALFPLLPQPQYVRFDTAALLRTDAETDARVDVQLIAGKILAPSEVRAKRNLPPMTDDQKAEADMVPLTVTPTGQAKALPALKNPPGPVAPVPAQDVQDEGVDSGN